MALRFWVPGGNGNTNSTTNWSALSGGASGASVPVAGDTATFDANSGVGTVTVNASFACAVWDSTNFGGTFAGSQAIACNGATFVWGAGITQNYTGTVTFSAGVAVSIASNGKQFKGPIIFNNAAGTFSNTDTLSSTSNVTLTAGTLSMGASLTATGTLTVTAGTFNTNSNALTVGIFSSSNTNTRSLTFGTSQIVVTSTGIVFTTANLTGLTFSMAAGAKLTVNNATASAKTVSPGAGQSFGDFNFTGAGSGTCTLNGGATFRDILVDNSAAGGFATSSSTTGCRDFKFSGYTGTWSGNSHIQYTGDFQTSLGMTKTHNGIIEGTATSGTHTVTTNSVDMGASIMQFNGIGGTWQLADALTASTGRLQVDAGTFLGNSKNITVALVMSNTANTRTLDLTNCAVKVTNVAVLKPVWNTLGITGLTVIATGSVITIDSTGGVGTQPQTFDAAGNQSYPHIVCQGTGSGGFTVGRDIEVDLIEFTQTNTNLFLYGQTNVKQLRITGPNTVQRGTVFKKYDVDTWVSQAA